MLLLSWSCLVVNPGGRYACKKSPGDGSMYCRCWGTSATLANLPRSLGSKRWCSYKHQVWLWHTIRLLFSVGRGAPDSNSAYAMNLVYYVFPNGDGFTCKWCLTNTGEAKWRQLTVNRPSQKPSIAPGLNVPEGLMGVSALLPARHLHCSHSQSHSELMWIWGPMEEGIRGDMGLRASRPINGCSMGLSRKVWLGGRGCKWQRQK